LQVELGQRALERRQRGFAGGQDRRDAGLDLALRGIGQLLAGGLEDLDAVVTRGVVGRRDDDPGAVAAAAQEL